MSAALIRSSVARQVSRSTRAELRGRQFTRGKASLPDLKYDYAALEPAISGQIMELHHSKHHQTYVTSYNNAIEQLDEAQSKSDVATQARLTSLINFHGGGHVNHTLFWENLAPTSQGGGDPPSGSLAKAIDQEFGGLQALKDKFNATLAGIQGSGWAWLVQDSHTGNIQIKTYAVSSLQYNNRKAEYFTAIWDVINWKAVEKRFT